MNEPTSGKPTMPSGHKEPIVIRGGVVIDAPRDDTRKTLVALLALGLRLDNVGVFLGSGASCDAGGKMMKDIWSAFTSSDPKAIEWLREASFLPAKDDLQTLPNLEELATRLDLRIEVYRETGDANLSDAQTHRAALQRAIMKAAVLDQTLWERRRATGDSSVVKLKDHLCLLARLLATPRKLMPAILALRCQNFIFGLTNRAPSLLERPCFIFAFSGWHLVFNATRILLKYLE
jgi:hypothetical protein